MKGLMKPDVILTWPSGCDYPLCRLQLQEFKKFFNKVIIAFYEHGLPDFRPWLKKNIPGAVFCEVEPELEDWRERAVTSAIKKSESDWILFTEQDFFAKDDSFYQVVSQARSRADVIGYDQGTRLHPFFLLTSRALLAKTSQDFSVRGQDQDHFSKVSKELFFMGRFVDLRDLGLREKIDWYHFSSMTWNIFRIKDNDIREFHDPASWLVYNAYSRTAKVKQNPAWRLFTYYAETLLSDFGKFLNE